MKRWLVLLASLAMAGCSSASETPTLPAPVQALATKGITIKGPLPAPKGYRGFVGEYRGRALPVYLLPDGEHTVIGSLYDRAGNDLTSDSLEAAAAPVLDETTWTELGKTRYIAEGATHPKRIVYVFTDTECPYCHKLWAATQPLLAGGDVQVRHILVAVIAPQSPYRAAAILDAADPLAALQKHEQSFGHSTVAPAKTLAPATEAALVANGELMDKLGVQGTPATVYRDADGAIRIAGGMLPDAQLKAIFGPR